MIYINEMEDVMEAYGSVMDIACEGEHVIDKKQREALDDSDFGIVTTENGKTARKYPLRVPGDKNKTKELLGKAIQFFHFCKGPYREELAKNIARVMREENVVVKIGKKAQIMRYLSESDLPAGCLSDE